MASDEGSSTVVKPPVSQIDLDLLVAVEGNDAAAVLQHIQNGAKVNCVHSEGPLRTVKYLIQSFPGSVLAQTNTGRYPFMIAADENSTASLSVIYELVRADPGVVVPRQIING